jgi:DNA-binding XRE family transcriptional regulator
MKNDNKLKVERNRSGLSQTELAVRAGVAPGLVNRLDKYPAARCSLATAKRLAGALGAPVADVFPIFAR